MRREWIEIINTQNHIHIYLMSPSMRREWIEISKHTAEHNRGERSPSMRREWIEMYNHNCYIFVCHVSLHAEGVD